MPDVTSAGHALGRLVIGHRAGIDLIDGLTGERNRVSGGEVVSLTPASVVHLGALLVTFADSSAILVVAREDGLHEIARYHTLPWFRSTVRVGDQLVRVGAEADRLELLRLGTSAVL